MTGARWEPSTQYSPRAKLRPHPVVRQHVLPIPLEVRERVEVRRNLHHAARHDPGVVPRPGLLARASAELVLRMDRQCPNVARDVRTTEEHAQGALRLLGAMELHDRVKSRDNLCVNGG